MTQQQRNSTGIGLASEDTTPQDIWSALPEEKAALWRGLEAWGDNFGDEAAQALRKAKANILAGKLDEVPDPTDLARQGRHAVDQLLSGAEISARQVTPATLEELVAGYWQRIAEQRDAAPTGLAGLDSALGGGLQPKRLMVILGAPGQGKTTLANQIAEHVANGGRPVVYATMEDPSWALMAKTMARLGGLDYKEVLQGWQSKRGAIDSALALLAQRRSAKRLLYLDVPGRLSLDELRERAQAHFAHFGVDVGGGPGLLVVDYLQRAARASMLMGVQSELRLAVSVLTDQLRDIARELDCTVLALGSQNRAGYGSGGSALASAKESGDIEYGVDVLAAIGEEGEEKKAKRIAPLGCGAWALNLAKNRQGETCTLALDWMPKRQQFTEVAK